MRSGILVLLAALLFCACAKTGITQLNEGANGVKIVLKEPSDCKRLGEIEGYKRNSNGNLTLQELVNSAKNELKNRAYALGADTLVIILADGSTANGGYYYGRGFYGPYGGGFYAPYSYPKEYIIHAVAFKCE